MFHPAAALHQPSLKTSVERDFARLPEWIEQALNNSGPQQASAQAAVTAQPARRMEVPVQEMLLLPETEPTEPPAVEEDPIQDGNERPTQLSLF
jgi:hypothetical protein